MTIYPVADSIQLSSTLLKNDQSGASGGVLGEAWLIIGIDLNALVTTNSIRPQLVDPSGLTIDLIEQASGAATTITMVAPGTAPVTHITLNDEVWSFSPFLFWASQMKDILVPPQWGIKMSNVVTVQAQRIRCETLVQALALRR